MCHNLNVRVLIIMYSVLLCLSMFMIILMLCTVHGKDLPNQEKKKLLLSVCKLPKRRYSTSSGEQLCNVECLWDVVGNNS